MIEGARIVLRAIERDELDLLLAWRNRPEFRRYFREHRELSGVQQERWFEEKVLGDANTRMFAIAERGDPAKLLGACGLCYIDWVNRSADFSIYIGRDSCYIDETWAPDAGRVLLGYGFDELGLHRVWCEVFAFDEAKKRLLPALGFRLDGRHRAAHWAEGAWHDSLFFGLLDCDFRAQRR
ncbi:MAG: GNAT family N-acetyltransferase [Stellaceae bacterium]